MSFQTEFEFTLPKGLVDNNGDVHKEGVMRLATAADEIVPLRDPRVQQNPAYLTIILLSRVIVRLGTLKTIDTNVIEKLFTADMTYLQDFYKKINESGTADVAVVCPQCGNTFNIG